MAKNALVQNPAFKMKKSVAQKKSMIFSAIKQVKASAAKLDEEELAQIDDHTDDLLDENGRVIRWRRIFDP